MTHSATLRAPRSESVNSESVNSELVNSELVKIASRTFGILCNFTNSEVFPKSPFFAPRG